MRTRVRIAHVIKKDGSRCTGEASRGSRAALALAAMLAASGSSGAAADSSGPFAHPATAEELRGSLLTRALARVEGSRILEGQFVQRRTPRGLARPLESRGDFLLARDLGIHWRTTAPVASELVITRSGFSFKDASGTTQRQPQLRVATELLFALFSLDLAALERRFELSGSGTPESWQIGLRSREPGRARTVRRAVIRGGETVESIALENGAGDEMQIELREVAARAGDLSDEERALFF